MPIASSIDTIATDNPEPAAVPVALIRSVTREDVLSLVEAAEERARRDEEFARWVTTVRDPAEGTHEGVRLLQSGNGRARAEYRIAALPDGRFALQTYSTYPGYAGQGTPWSAFATREACVSEFLSRARTFFREEPTGCASHTDSRSILRVASIAYLLRCSQLATFSREFVNEDAYQSHRLGRLQILPMFAETLFGFVEPPPHTEDQLPPCVDDEAEEPDADDE